MRLAEIEAKRLEEEQKINTAKLLKNYMQFRFKFDPHQTANFIQITDNGESVWR